MHHHEHEGGQFVSVKVITTDGSYPDQGFDHVPSHQPLHVQLEKAARALHLVDTTGWVARVAGESAELDVTKSYDQLGLTGEVTIDFAATEGGGGCA